MPSTESVSEAVAPTTVTDSPSLTRQVIALTPLPPALSAALNVTVTAVLFQAAAWAVEPTTPWR